MNVVTRVEELPIRRYEIEFPYVQTHHGYPTLVVDTLAGSAHISCDHGKIISDPLPIRLLRPDILLSTETPKFIQKLFLHGLETIGEEALTLPDSGQDLDLFGMLTMIKSWPCLQTIDHQSKNQPYALLSEGDKGNFHQVIMFIAGTTERKVTNGEVVEILSYQNSTSSIAIEWHEFERPFSRFSSVVSGLLLPLNTELIPIPNWLYNSIYDLCCYWKSNKTGRWAGKTEKSVIAS